MQKTVQELLEKKCKTINRTKEYPGNTTGIRIFLFTDAFFHVQRLLANPTHNMYQDISLLYSLNGILTIV